MGRAARPALDVAALLEQIDAELSASNGEWHALRTLIDRLADLADARQEIAAQRSIAERAISELGLIGGSGRGAHSR